MFFPFITGKNFAFRIIVELILGGWLILAWRDAAYRLRFSWILGALTVFLGIITLAALFGEDPIRSFWSNYERMDGLITLLHLFAYFVVAGSMFQEISSLWKRFLQTSLVASAFISIYSIFQLLGFITINQGGVRIDATFGNATYLASYLLFHVFFAVLLFAGEKKSIVLRSLYGVAFALNVFILFNTATRGAILALIVGVFLTAILMLFTNKTPVLRKSALGIFVALAIIIGVFMFVKDTEFIRGNPALGRLSNISLETGNSRFLVWGMAWEGVKEHPILGWGQDNFILTFNKYYDPRMYGQEPWFDRAHNIIFDWLIAGGFLGLLAYLSIFLALLYLIWFYPRKKSSEHDILFSPLEKSILTGLLAAYFFQNLFVFDNVMSYILFFSVLAFVHGRSIEKKDKDARSSRLSTFYNNKLVAQMVAPVVLIVVVSGLYFINIKGIRASQALLHGIDMRTVQSAETTEAQLEALEEKLENFKKALKSSLGRTEAREQLIQASIAFAGAPISEDIKQQFFTLARDEMLAQIKETPENVRNHLFLASLFTAYSMPEETIIYLEKALSISPKKQHIHFILANAYFNRGEIEKAIEILRVSFELEPRNDKAFQFYVAALIRTGKEAQAEELLIERYGSSREINATIVNAYLSIGQIDKVILFWQEKIDENPNDVQSYISLAAAFLKMDDRGKAIEQLTLTIERFPDFAEQGEFFIKEIKAGRNP